MSNEWEIQWRSSEDVDIYGDIYKSQNAVQLYDAASPSYSWNSAWLDD